MWIIPLTIGCLISIYFEHKKYTNRTLYWVEGIFTGVAVGLLMK